MTQMWSDMSRRMATFGWNDTTKKRYPTSRSLACGRQVLQLPPGTSGVGNQGWAYPLRRNIRGVNGPDTVIFVKRIELTIKLRVHARASNKRNLRCTPATSGRWGVIGTRIPAGSASTRLANSGRGLWRDQGHLPMMSSKVG